VISGNTSIGVLIQGNSNLVEGNLVGTNPAGTRALGNGGGGVYIIAASNAGVVGGNNNTIGGTTAAARNVIDASGSAANRHNGVAISSPDATILASGNVVEGNFIGTDVTGTRALGNSGSGVLLSSLESGNTIGGTAPGAGNLISGNGIDGVALWPGAGGDVVQGNFIGTDVTGTHPLGNANAGVEIRQAFGNIIGGTVPGAGNLISGNTKDGVLFDQASAVNLVEGNAIGTDVSGTHNLGNGGNGVNVTGAAANNTIGGTSAGAGNVIAFNAGRGVDIASGTGDAVRANSIWANKILGIDLGNNGVVLNDSKGHIGPNDYENFPVIGLAMAGTNTLSLAGSLQSTPNTTFALDFFASPAADPSGYGQGQTYLGSLNVTTNAAGVASFSDTLNLANAVAPGEVLTVTATDPGGNTSEFGRAVTVTG
jgi:titin